jgi:DNA-binding XRE family transcriptional regulator
VKVRATGLKALRENCGLTQRKLAHELGISQQYIPAIEVGARHAGPKLQQQMAGGPEAHQRFSNELGPASAEGRYVSVGSPVGVEPHAAKIARATPAT